MHKSEFLEKLKTNFSDSELQDICFELEVDYENVPGISKADKARELILYLDRRERLPELWAICQQLRPNVIWRSSDSALADPKELRHTLDVQIRNVSRRLNKLREIEAVKGIDTDPHYLIEIEDLEKKLDELRKQRKNI